MSDDYKWDPSPLYQEYARGLPKSLPLRIRNAILRATDEAILCSFEEFKALVLAGYHKKIYGVGTIGMKELQRHLADPVRMAVNQDVQ